MFSANLYEALDRSIDVLMADPDTHFSNLDSEMAAMLATVGDLRCLARPAFKAELLTALLGKVFVAGTPVGSPISSRSTEGLLPTLFGTGMGTYPMQRTNFMASALIHTAAIALITTSAFWVASHKVNLETSQHVLLVEPYAHELFTVSKTISGGGGGGGDHDKVAASRGRLPRQAWEQITPPTVVIRNNHPLLTAEPTVVAPPLNVAANMPNLGDPLSKVMSPPSDGTGSGGGIGAGSGGGVGIGTGGGVGTGTGGGFGGGVFRVGGGVSAPRVMYSPDPQYSEEARKAKYQGTVVLWAVIGANGRPQELRVSR